MTGMVVNYFITLPIYSNMFGGVDALVAMVGSLTPGFLPTIDSLWKIIIIGITPFNVVKGIMIAVVSYYVFKLVKNHFNFNDVYVILGTLGELGVDPYSAGVSQIWSIRC